MPKPKSVPITAAGAFYNQTRIRQHDMDPGSGNPNDARPQGGGNKMERKLEQYNFQQEDFDYIERTSNWTARNHAAMFDWLSTLNPAQAAKVAELNVAQKAGLFTMSESQRDHFFAHGFNSPFTEWLEGLK